MRPPDTVIIDRKAYSWRRITEIRRRQVEVSIGTEN